MHLNTIAEEEVTTKNRENMLQSLFGPCNKTLYAGSALGKLVDLPAGCGT